MVEQLVRKGKNAILNLYGEGTQRSLLEQYVKENKLENCIFLKGNHHHETIKKAYQESHFVVLPSKSEGWPKAIAEGMFWGCVPLASKVSCVPFMLDYGNRGVLLEIDLEKDVAQTENIISNQNTYSVKSQSASGWSRLYTTDIFETEIKNLLVK